MIGVAVFVDALRTSGTHTWCHLVSDDQVALSRMAKKLHASIKRDGRGYHVDLTPHQRDLAIRYGAIAVESSN